METRALPIERTRTLRPNGQLVSQSRRAVVAMTIPLFTAMLWFSIPRGTWPRVLVAVLLISAVGAVAAALLARVRIVIGRDSVFENGFFFQNRRISAKRIASADIVQVYRGQSLESTPQLFLLDASGGLLLRMRGQYWSAEHLNAVAAAYGVPVRARSEPITKAQLRHDFADQIFWFERWPVAGAFSVAGAIAAFTLLLIALMSSEALVIRS